MCVCVYACVCVSVCVCECVHVCVCVCVCGACVLQFVHAAKTNKLTFLLSRQRSKMVSVYLLCKANILSISVAIDILCSNSMPTL